MCLWFAFLLITRVASWLRLSQREDAWKTAEILILRHQLAVLERRQRQHPNLSWADRALVGVIPEACRHEMRLLVTPDTILRWHRDLVRRRWAARSKRGRTGRRELLDRDPSGTRPICGGSCASTRSTTISTGRTDPCAAPRH